MGWNFLQTLSFIAKMSTFPKATNILQILVVVCNMHDCIMMDVHWTRMWLHTKPWFREAMLDTIFALRGAIEVTLVMDCLTSFRDFSEVTLVIEDTF